MKVKSCSRPNLVFSVDLVHFPGVVVVLRQRAVAGLARRRLTVAARQTEPRPVGLLSSALPAGGRRRQRRLLVSVHVLGHDAAGRKRSAATLTTAMTAPRAASVTAAQRPTRLPLTSTTPPTSIQHY